VVVLPWGASSVEETGSVRGQSIASEALGALVGYCIETGARVARNVKIGWGGSGTRA